MNPETRSGILPSDLARAGCAATLGECMGVAAILQGDATRTEALGFADLAKAKRNVAALLELIGTGLAEFR